MTELESFKGILDKRGYPYREEGERLIVDGLTSSTSLRLPGVKSIPPCVSFVNFHSIILDSLEELPFRTELATDYVYLTSLRRIDSSVRINESMLISPLTEKSDISILRIVFKFAFSVSGISDNRVLNRMISLGLFDKKGFNRK
jgi:hypothetical protein